MDFSQRFLEIIDASLQERGYSLSSFFSAKSFYALDTDSNKNRCDAEN